LFLLPAVTAATDDGRIRAAASSGLIHTTLVSALREIVEHLIFARQAIPA